jgi:glycosyltransferase involved in cell wall biosynthesis
VGFFGPLVPYIGYGYGSLNLIDGLTSLGKRVFLDQRYPGTAHLFQTHPSHEALAQQIRQQGELEFPRAGILHTVPDEFWRTRYAHTVGFTMWETSAIPGPNAPGQYKDWAKKINAGCDQLLVPSAHSREVFRAGGVTVPISVVHYGIDFTEWPLLPPKKQGSTFRVLLFGDLSTRKSPFELCAAFQRAFPAERYPDAQLILKTQQGRLGAGSLPYISDPRVVVINERYSHAQLVDLIASCHLFVWPSRGEGFGLPPIQVAAMGVPVAMTTHTGMAEYYDPKYFYGINHTEPEDSLYCGEWLPPDIDHLASVLQSVYTNYNAARAKAKLAATYVRKTFTNAQFAQSVLTSVH